LGSPSDHADECLVRCLAAGLVDVNRSAESSTGLAGSPLEVDDSLRRFKIDALCELAYHRQCIHDLSDDVF
jgi:hypothetical protein